MVRFPQWEALAGGLNMFLLGHVMLHPYSVISGGVSQVNCSKDYYIGLDCGTESIGFAVTA